jgi:phosphonate transport system substrate-binding protein
MAPFPLRRAAPRLADRTPTQRVRARMLLLAATGTLPWPLRAGADGAYALGIFPYLAPRQTLDFFGPVAAWMGAALGHPVRLTSAASFPDFSRALAEQRYDIALVQPFDVLQAVEQYGYLPLAQLSVPLVTQIYVRDDSPYHRIEDLRGTTVAMPPPQTANARMSLRALLDHQLVPGRDLELRYFNSHDSCIQQVWAGIASACGTAKPPIQIFEQRMQARLRPIYDTPPIPHVMFVVHSRVPAPQRERLQALLLGWKDDAAGRALLKNLGFPGFVAPRLAEYEVLRHYDPGGDDVVTDTRLGTTLRLGVYPFLAPRLLAERYAPSLPRLGRAAEMPVQLRTASSSGAFIEALSRHAYDIAVIQPFDYALATQQGYRPLAGMRAPLQGRFFVRTDSAIHQVADLRGKVVAMPPPEAAQSRLGLQALRDTGLTPGRDVTVDHRRTHDACLQQVQLQAAAACVTTPLALRLVAPSLAAGLRAVGRTAEVPGVLFMAHERVPLAMREHLAAEIIGWKDSDDGRRILRSIGIGDFVAVDAKAYEALARTYRSR